MGTRSLRGFRKLAEIAKFESLEEVLALLLRWKEMPIGRLGPSKKKDESAHESGSVDA
ncbi:MAG: hypothetical protein QOF14_3722 [Hyphomicrobiales bacterium]|jgi:hypothetical protein|nr:hypothetical protein [Hyphomicrobiales bacterium]